MAKRGKILRDPQSGPGLLILEGRQHQFLVEGVWRSDVHPKPGLVVDVEFDSQNKICGITPAPEGQIAKPQAEAGPPSHNENWRACALSKVAKVRLPQLVAAGVLMLCWSFLTAVSIQLAFPGKVELTFWQVLGWLNASDLTRVLEERGNGGGYYELLAMVAIAGPFVHHFWKDRRAWLGGLLPLGFMLLVGWMVRSSVQGPFGDADGAYLALQRQGQDGIMKAMRLGVGSYLSMIVSVYLATLSVRQFLAGEGSEPQGLGNSQKAVA